MEYNKKQIEEKLYPIVTDGDFLKTLGMKRRDGGELFQGQPINLTDVPIFKSSIDDDYSLTQFGYQLLTAIKFYEHTYVGLLPKDFITVPNNLLAINKYFKTPYYIHNTQLYYFDEVLNAEICINGSLEEYITNKKNAKSFNQSQ